MLALGSADKKGAVGMGIHKNPKRTINEQEQFTLQHYVKAISHLQPHFSAKDRTSCRVALIACVVFVCLEFLRGHYKTAQLHLQNGIEILSHMQGLSDVKSGVLALKHSPDWADDRIVEAISRLHLQVELFRHLYQHSCLIIKPALDPQKPPITQFHSLNDAWKYLDPIFNKIFYLTHRARQQLISAAEQMLQNELKARLGHWLQLFDAFCKEQPCEGNDDLEKLYQILRINHTMVSIMADTCLRSDENVYDLYTDHFILLIAQLSRLWVVSARTEDLEVEMSLHLTYMPRAIMDVGWIPPLYFTAVKCRVHRLRVQAIRLLRTSPHREGIWDASIAACVASKVVEMEEGGFYQGFDLEDDFLLETLPSKQDLALPLLPESHRLSEAEVELSGAPMDRISLFCKREEDGINRKVLLSQYSVPLQFWIDT
ncbi:hypothetical protein NM208_g16584 [Fusarium decemcellulare]|uniref:Uncharacterized protein n=1 Tax=Fusarium decemcellulare TaxID=57161 RepID=A0ACC1R9S4_9HYPO|nr:hypothetical protein NM208_g16584 [Fusarium decemcellulare]